MNNVYSILLERVKVKETFETFLKNNSLLNYDIKIENINVKDIEEKIRILKNGKIFSKLEKLYNEKYDTLEPYSILKFSERAKVPFIFTRQFLIDKKSSKRVREDHIEQIEEHSIEEHIEEYSIEDIRKKRLLRFM